MSMTNRDIFKRVATAYDPERMKRSRIGAIGTGGSRSFLEDMARCGVGQFGLIDHDVVEVQNIATQQVFLEDIGRAKVDAVADRIIQINPDARVEVYQKALEELDDSEVERLALMPLGNMWQWSNAYVGHLFPDITLLVAMTDNFYAQARVNRLGLQFGLPTLSCMLYQYGQAGEITFTYPGVTPACQRCILSPRYKAYLERGYQ